MLLVRLYYGLAFYEGATMALNKPKFQLQNLLGCAILSWHAGMAPEIGFSAPSMERPWWIVSKCNQSPLILPLLSVRFELKQTELQNLEDDLDSMSCVRTSETLYFAPQE
jgi:hypothetical protein